MIKIKLKKTHPDATLPVANNDDVGTGDTGFDLTAVEDVQIREFDSAVVPVGLTLADITPGYWIKIEPRSGLGFKHSIQPHLGVIDNGYRGDLGVKLYKFNEGHHKVKKGDKIAQLVVYKLNQPVFEFTDEVTDTSRGDKGFGSSDKPESSGYNDNVQWEHDEYKGTHNAYDQTNVDPWLIDDVEELLTWCREHPDIVYDELFQDLLSNAISLRKNKANV